MELNLYLLEIWESDFQGKHYKMFRFIDKQSLTIINGTDLQGNLKVGNTYKCNVIYKNKSLKVVSAA